MSRAISAYTFLPWLRQGIAQDITATDLDPAVKLRATIDVQVELKGLGLDGTELAPEPIKKTVQLLGPGDIVGIERRAIIKTDPRDWITNFEPNYLPCIDFYEEDFPWRYTPAAPDVSKHRLRPWIALVVLKEGEFEEGTDIKDKPLPFIKVTNAANVFPPAEQLWAWAHVHVNRDLADTDDTIVPPDMAAVLTKLQSALAENPDLAYSRILCPRRLEENAAYHAFLMPVFEDGRLAGLGLDLTVPSPDQQPIPKSPYATFSAWANYPDNAANPKEEAEHFPYYHRWYFRTGTVGDFEDLVRLLEPKPVDKDVGRRDMDVQAPGSNITGITDEELGGVLKLGGALQVDLDTLKEEDKPEILKYEHWDRGRGATPDDESYPHDLQKDLAAFINLADDYSTKTAQQAHNKINADPDLNLSIPIDPEDPDDPLITPPLYGRWHALTQRLLKERGGGDISPNDNWVHQLNLDPRYRVAASFGTKVVQQNQEEYMNAAWEQIGDVLAANQQIRQGQLAKEVSAVWYARHLLPLLRENPERAFVLTAPVQNRVIFQGFTVSHQLNTSFVPRAVTSGPARRVLRPGGRMMKSLGFSGAVQPHNLIARLDKREVTAAPPKTVPKGAVSVGDLAEEMLPRTAPKQIVRLLRRYPWLKYAPLALALLVLLLLFLLKPSGIWLTLGGAVIAISLYLYRVLARLSQEVAHADSILDDNQTPEAVDRLPESPDFRLTRPDEAFTPSRGTTDSPEAVRFKDALRSANSLFVASREAVRASEDRVVPAKHALDLPAVTNTIMQAIDPNRTIPARIFGKVKLPERLIKPIGDQFKEVMAYPEFDTPMYEPLVNLSSELFLPNINKVEQNSISLLETNQAFIEAYMVGLNHEFARELLWREYPTDQRGSYFRQFWDVSSYLDTTETNLGKWHKKLGDILRRFRGFSSDLDETQTDLERLREKLRDIPPLHEWKPPRKPPTSRLGDHDHRETSGTKEEEVVLVIRGELLKKYPNAVIYAHRAEWQTTSGKIDNSKERRLVELSTEEEEEPPRDKVRTPLYKAKVEPDIFFFGFDLTTEVARGGTGEKQSDDPGWFFVIKERPGEARFGADVSREGELTVWNDLAWPDVLPGDVAGAYIPMDDSTPSLSLPVVPLPGNDPRRQQWENDQSVAWNENVSAADIAYILYQAPMMVAVHAAEMLRKE